MLWPKEIVGQGCLWNTSRSFHLVKQKDYLNVLAIYRLGRFYDMEMMDTDDWFLLAA